MKPFNLVVALALLVGSHVAGGSVPPRAAKLEPWPEAEEQKVDALLARAALKAQRVATVGYMNKLNAAILECLRLNPGHAKAAELLKTMGGRITR
jgi:hypothetical protein